MIPVKKCRAPARYRTEVLERGNRWLAKNQATTSRPPPYWLEIRDELARSFCHRCGYSAMYEPVGTVDHYLSIEGGHRNLAYMWSNFRYAAGWVNSSKGVLDAQALDPFEVKEDWFQLLLPSLQLVLTSKVPARLRKKAQFTIDRLQLAHGEQVLRQRRAWYEKYLEGKAPLELLDDWAPLLADAIRRQKTVPKTRKPGGTQGSRR